MSREINLTRSISIFYILERIGKLSQPRRLFFALGGVLLLTFGVLSGQAEAQETRTFQIIGDSNGIGWSWGIGLTDGNSVEDRRVGPVPAGQRCEALTQVFVASINREGEPLGISAEVVEDCLFQITAPLEFQFFVGKFDQDPFTGCEVTPEGCQFNPVIMEVEL